MKTTLVFRSVIILCLAICLGCSKDSIDEVTVTKCYVVIETDTDLPVANVRIDFEGDLRCGGGGCGYNTIISGNSNDNGEVCVTLSQLDFEKITLIRCMWNGFIQSAGFDSLPNLSIIYVDHFF